MFEALFGVLLFGSCAYGAMAGGRDGMWVAAAFMVAAILSVPAGGLDAWSATQLPVFIVDLALLIVLIRVAIRSDAFWPLWSTAFHVLSIASHAATIAEPRIKPMLYFSVQALWSLPCILVMVIGISIDRDASRRGRLTGPGRSFGERQA